MTKIVFMGTPAFSAPILRMLVEEGYEVISVVTQPDRPVGRKKVMTATPVKEEAMRLGLPVYQPEKLKNPEELQHVLDLEADLRIAIDDSVRTWTQTYYAMDSGDPLIIVNHGTAEENGMRLLHAHLQEVFSLHEVIHFNQGRV